MELRIRCIEGPISTDDIIPGKYKHMYVNPEDMAHHIFENKMPGFAKTVEQYDAIFCKDIFGIGSSREQAVSSLLASGIKVVIAPLFGRIFYRNCWNLGLIPIEMKKIELTEKEKIYIDLENGEIKTEKESYYFTTPPKYMLDLYHSGGILNYIKKQLNV